MLDRFAELGEMIGRGLTPEQFPVALEHCGLKPDDLVDYMEWQTTGERLGRVPTALLVQWRDSTREGVSEEAKAGRFAQARRVQDMHERITRALVGRR